MKWRPRAFARVSTGDSGIDVNLLGDSHCGIARVVTVQRQRRSVAWALGDQGFHCDFAGDDLIITFLGLSFLTLMLGD